MDGEQFIRLRREIEGLRPLQERKSLLQRSEKEYTERRRILLDEWEGIKAQELQLLVKATKTIGRKLRDDVQVEVTAAGDREPLFKLLREEVGGRLSETINSLGEKKDFTLPFFVKSCRMGPEAVREAYGVPAKQAHSLAQAPADVLMRVEELELQTATTIRLNTAPSGEQPTWQALKDLSTGQKATAVLLLLLLESDAPLIVDQPEDDLDNRFISEAVVPRMREEKCRRQFIFSTHNANIPVLGDAELILGLTAAGEADAVGKAQIAPEHIGSIDRQTVCEMIENLLEGGRNTFETRRRKYGFLGVEQEQTVSGLTRDRTKAEERVMEAARTHVQAATIPYWQTINWDEQRVIGIVSLPADGPDKPYKVKYKSAWVTKIRAGTSTRDGSRQEEERLYQQSGRLRYGLKPVPGSSIDRLDRRRLCDYFVRVLGGHAPDESDAEGWQTLLVNLDLAILSVGGTAASIDGTLLFGKNPRWLLPRSPRQRALQAWIERDVDPPGTASIWSPPGTVPDGHGSGSSSGLLVS